MLQRGGYVPSRPSTTSPGRPQALPGRICFSCPGCSASTEMSVRHQPKRLFGFIRNRCTTSSEMAVRHTPKWLFVFARDTQAKAAMLSTSLSVPISEIIDFENQLALFSAMLDGTASQRIIIIETPGL